MLLFFNLFITLLQKIKKISINLANLNYKIF